MTHKPVNITEHKLMLPGHQFALLPTQNNKFSRFPMPKLQSKRDFVPNQGVEEVIKLQKKLDAIGLSPPSATGLAIEPQNLQKKPN